MGGGVSFFVQGAELWIKGLEVLEGWEGERFVDTLGYEI